MYSKLLFLTLILSLMASCSLDTDDNQSKETIEVSGTASTLSCIDDEVLPYFSSGISLGDPSAGDKAFACLEHTIDVVNEHVNVRSKKPITKAALIRLIKNKTRNYNESTEEVLDVFFDLKHKFVRGDSESLTHKELKEIKSVLEDFSQVFSLIQPIISVISVDEGEFVSDSQINEVSQNVDKAGAVLKKLFVASDVVISKEDIRSWVDTTDVLKKTDALAKWDLYWQFHSTLWHDQKEKVTKHNIDQWISGIKNLILVSVKQKHRWTADRYIEGQDTEDILNHIDDFMKLFKRSIESRTNKTIPYEEIYSLIEKYEAVNKLPRGLQIDTLKDIIPKVFEKLIGVNDSLRDNENYQRRVFGVPFEGYYQGFTIHHYEMLDREYKIYKATQRAIKSNQLKLSTHFTGPYAPYLREFVNIISDIQGYFPAPGEIQVTDPLTGDLIKSADEYGIYLSKKASNKYNKRNLTLFNLFNIFARGIARGYVTDQPDPRLVYKSISVGQIARFMGDFEGFFEEIYLMEKRSSAAKVAGRIYLESKLFVSSGDGFKGKLVDGKEVNSRVTNVEAVEVMSHYFSGIYTNGKAYDKLAEICSLEKLNLRPSDVSEHYQPPVVFEQQPLLKSCFIENYLQVLSMYVGNMPNLQKYLRNYIAEKTEAEFDFKSELFRKNKSIQGWEEKFNEKYKNRFDLENKLIYSGQHNILKDLEGNPVHVPIEENPYINRADVSIMGTLIYFLESSIIKFDTDENNKIDKDEVNNSYYYLKDLIILSGAKQCTEAGFRYILLAHADDSFYMWNSRSRWLKECTTKRTIDIAEGLKNYIRNALDRDPPHQRCVFAIAGYMVDTESDDASWFGVKEKLKWMSYCLGITSSEFTEKQSGKSLQDNVTGIVDTEPKTDTDIIKDKAKEADVNEAKEKLVQEAVPVKLNNRGQISVDHGDMLDIITFIKNH